MPVLPPADLAPAATNVAPPDVLSMTPRQVAESDWATQNRYATARRLAAERAAAEADQRVQDQQFISALTQNARMQNAEKAVTAALRFQGVRGFERDINAARASGLSNEQATLQALMRNGARMFAEAPGDLTPAIRSFQAPREVAARPGMPAYVTVPQGNVLRFAPNVPPSAADMPAVAEPVEGLPGYSRARSGPSSYQYFRTAPSTSEQLRLLTARIESAQNSLLLPGTKEEKAARQNRLNSLLQELDQLGASSSAQPTGDASPVVPRPAPGGIAPPSGATSSPAPTGFILIRRKSDGARFRYPAARAADLKGDDRYELVK